MTTSSLAGRVPSALRAPGISFQLGVFVESLRNGVINRFVERAIERAVALYEIDSLVTTLRSVESQDVLEFGETWVAKRAPRLFMGGVLVTIIHKIRGLPEESEVYDFLKERQLPPELLQTAFAHYFLLKRFWSDQDKFDVSVLSDLEVFSAFHCWEVANIAPAIPWANLKILGDRVMEAWAQALRDDDLLFTEIWDEAGSVADKHGGAQPELVDWFIRAHALEQLASNEDLQAASRVISHDPDVGDWTLIFTFKANTPLEARTLGRRAREAIALRPFGEQGLVSVRVLRQPDVTNS